MATLENVEKPPAPSEAPTCAICLSAITDKTALDACIHVYCYECISAWVRTASNCPQCKATVKTLVRHDKSGTALEPIKVRAKKMAQATYAHNLVPLSSALPLLAGNEDDDALHIPLTRDGYLLDDFVEPDDSDEEARRLIDDIENVTSLTEHSDHDYDSDPLSPTNLCTVNEEGFNYVLRHHTSVSTQGRVKIDLSQKTSKRRWPTPPRDPIDEIDEDDDEQSKTSVSESVSVVDSPPPAPRPLRSCRTAASVDATPVRRSKRTRR